jgi:hypothetical protein
MGRRRIHEWRRAGCRIEEAQMSNENVLFFLEGLRKRNADQNLGDAKMDARLAGFRLLIPVVEKLREMGLSDSEIGRFLKFLGDELVRGEGQEQ